MEVAAEASAKLARTSAEAAAVRLPCGVTVAVEEARRVATMVVVAAATAEAAVVEVTGAADRPKNLYFPRAARRRLASRRAFFGLILYWQQLT